MVAFSLILSTFINFVVAFTKGYIVNSCLAPHLNPDNEAVVIQQPAALTFYEQLGMRLCSYK